ncbi:hypothetical protein AVEN_273024-1 [Araneus ventricosus]|uniref:Uncharacterized protein n=1 Tax=Araneus ventricosus TaxID=182803 RepID=A0A4Y2MJ15_ARAVE|nr:hypothetical protein AVEN_273024-1 [Araneus ventricosus]
MGIVPVISILGQMSRTTPELAPPPSPNVRTTPEGGHLPPVYNLTCTLTQRIFSGIVFEFGTPQPRCRDPTTRLPSPDLMSGKTAQGSIHSS